MNTNINVTSKPVILKNIRVIKLFYIKHTRPLVIRISGGFWNSSKRVNKSSTNIGRNWSYSQLLLLKNLLEKPTSCFLGEFVYIGEEWCRLSAVQCCILLRPTVPSESVINLCQPSINGSESWRYTSPVIAERERTEEYNGRLKFLSFRDEEH